MRPRIFHIGLALAGVFLFIISFQWLYISENGSNLETVATPNHHEDSTILPNLHVEHSQTTEEIASGSKLIPHPNMESTFKARLGILEEFCKKKAERPFNGFHYYYNVPNNVIFCE